MPKIQTNGSGSVYTVNGSVLTIGENVESITKDVILARVSDDNGNQIGTHYMNFVDANGTVYKVVLLDAQYRNASATWCSYENSAVTGLPLYSNTKNSNALEAKETATFNTQKILDFCTAGGYTSTACSHCRSKSFTIGEVTYYGQLPNLVEIIHLGKHYNEFDALDTSASTSTSTNFSSAYTLWSSTQAFNNKGWYFSSNCIINNTNKHYEYFTAPVLEIPVA